MSESTDLTQRETKVLQCLMEAEGPLTIREMAKQCFARERPLAKAESRVRNAIRRLVEVGIIEQVARGTYAAAPVGTCSDVSRAVEAAGTAEMALDEFRAFVQEVLQEPVVTENPPEPIAIDGELACPPADA